MATKMKQGYNQKYTSAKSSSYLGPEVQIIRNWILGPIPRGAALNRDQRGITSVETIILLIAFIVVASGFAFPGLITGLRGSQGSEEPQSIDASQSSATLVLQSGVIGTANPDNSGLDSIRFTLTSGGKSAKSVNLSYSNTTITYIDQNQAVNLPFTNWSTTWWKGSGPVLDPGETMEINVTLAGLLTKPLGPSSGFTIRVDPDQGAGLMINRTTPDEIKPVVYMY